ncbi:MAG: WXG100 family type VII secretion target [Planctomycetales bacterium]|nr:WXG100 family type VII secretion target [Planctomycetales bacterium]MCA9164882.1 WXG100 family type VII secretion target [Planctomycetales bacterium]MCA9201585.1 WXG100 family type VII secretion target [Planctomycetales bacterium]MCA9207776.1 WXG100 family type VII secretion target [Planctomycetales bacterium]MCA9222937.1 WXG100 family type VII secretion target [Planctomycetales bacterium]
MAQAVVDPEELRQFAGMLRKFNNELRDRMNILNNQMAALGATWRDQEQRKFAEQFDENMRAMARFSDIADRHVPYLLRKAEQIEEYLNTR